MRLNIAILGTSPVQVLYALELSKSNDVTVYDKSLNAGGAWQTKLLNGNFLPTYNNIICPLSELEEKLLDPICSHLSYNVEHQLLMQKN